MLSQMRQRISACKHSDYIDLMFMIQKSICMSMHVSHVQQLEADRNQFFHRHLPIRCALIQHAQMPRSRDLAIFLPTTTTTALESTYPARTIHILPSLGSVGAVWHPYRHLLMFGKEHQVGRRLLGGVPTSEAIISSFRRFQ